MRPLESTSHPPSPRLSRRLPRVLCLPVLFNSCPFLSLQLTTFPLSFCDAFPIIENARGSRSSLHFAFFLLCASKTSIPSLFNSRHLRERPLSRVRSSHRGTCPNAHDYTGRQDTEEPPGFSPRLSEHFCHDSVAPEFYTRETDGAAPLGSSICVHKFVLPRAGSAQDGSAGKPARGAPNVERT